MICSHSYIKSLGGFEDVQIKVSYGWFTLFNISGEEAKAVYQIWDDKGRGSLVFHFLA